MHQHQLKHFKELVVSIWILLIPIASLCQSKQEWIVVKGVNTFLQIGVAKPIKIDPKEVQKAYFGKSIYIRDSLLFLSKSFRQSGVYADTIFIKERKTFKVKPDNDETFKYPGDELSCQEEETIKSCFVGKSFMKLLGSKASTLTFYNLRANGPNFFPYKLCVIKKNETMGLLLENASLLLIIKRKHKK